MRKIECRREDTASRGSQVAFGNEGEKACPFLGRYLVVHRKLEA